MFKNDTIAAFATASSSGAVALLRISGPDALKALCALTKKNEFKDRKATLVKVYDNQSVLDNALATVFKAPNSYTGEDVVEFTLHAGPYIKSRILELLADFKIRPAKGGEFTLRAFLNNKMDLAEAQGVADIIAAKNKAAHKAAVNSLEGKLSQKFKDIKDGLLDLLAQTEVRIDDVDDEMQPLDESKTQNNLNAIIDEIIKTADSFSSGRLVKNGIRTAIVGIPNSGKSSLLNTLLNYNRAIVSPVSGTTRDTVEAEAEINGFNLVLIDTAGIREHAVDPAEKEGMLRTKAAAKEADLILFLQDNFCGDSALAQEALWREVQAYNKKVLKIIGKADLLPADFKADDAALISCKTGLGIEELKNKIVEAIGLAALHEDDIIITSAAQYEALTSASKELILARENIKDLELLAEHLRAAALHLKQLIGEVTPDDVLDVIFSKFCVGK